MSFSRILPASSNLPGVIPKSFSKFDVRMNFISQMFSKIDFKLFFIVGSTNLFFILPQCLINSWWCFSSSFLNFEDRRRISLKSCSILFKTRDSSLLPSSHNCFRLWEFFSPIRSNSGVFSVWFFEDHHFGLILSQLSALVLQILSVHHSSIL